MSLQLKNNQHKKYFPAIYCIVFCLFSSSVRAETVPYVIPPPPDMLDQRIELIEPVGVLSQTEALSLALLHNPTLQDFAWNIRMSDVKTIRASLLPNPELTIEAENFLGSGQQKNFDQAETTVSISQLFELGEKRSKRKALALTERDLALWDYETQRMNIIYLLTIRYVHVLANQARVRLAIESTNIAEELHKISRARVDTGVIPPLEQRKARIELAKSRLHKTKVSNELISKKQNLAAVWGSVTPQFKKVSGDLLTLKVPPIPELSALLSRINNNPDLARWSAEIERYKKAIALAKAQKIPNITFTAGGRHFAEENNFAVVAGISTPLFIFNTQQTGVDTAEMILTQAIQRKRAATITIRTKLIESYQQLEINQASIKVIRNEILPNVKEVIKAAKTAYKLGEIGSLDLLDAQRTSFQSENQHLEEIVNFQLNVAKIERLIGGALNSSTHKIPN